MECFTMFCVTHCRAMRDWLTQPGMLFCHARDGAAKQARNVSSRYVLIVSRVSNSSHNRELHYLYGVWGHHYLMVAWDISSNGRGRHAPSHHYRRPHGDLIVEVCWVSFWDECWSIMSGEGCNVAVNSHTTNTDIITLSCNRRTDINYHQLPDLELD